MLKVNNLQVSYGGMLAIQDASFKVDEGEAVAIIGSNGAGKSTLLKTIVGVESAERGEILFYDKSLTGLATHEIVKRGIAYVPEGRRLFALLSVVDNLMLGAISRETTPQSMKQDLEEIYEIFPVLAERRYQKAGTLSGGEQQMAAIGRGLMFKPKLIMLDEPSLGLMPKYVTTVFEVLQKVKRMTRVSILVVEQKVKNTLELCDRAYILQTGRTIKEGTGDELAKDDMIKKAYLGL